MYVEKCSIIGLKMLNYTIFISQIADDVTLFLKDEHSLNIAIKSTNTFAKYSGVKV